MALAIERQSEISQLRPNRKASVVSHITVQYGVGQTLLRERYQLCRDLPEPGSIGVHAAEAAAEFAFLPAHQVDAISQCPLDDNRTDYRQGVSYYQRDNQHAIQRRNHG